MAVSVENAGGLAVRKPRRLFGRQLALQFDSALCYAVAPDGRLPMVRPYEDRSLTPELRAILNWFADRRRAR